MLTSEKTTVHNPKEQLEAVYKIISKDSDLSDLKKQLKAIFVAIKNDTLQKDDVVNFLLAKGLLQKEQLGAFEEVFEALKKDDNLENKLHTFLKDAEKKKKVEDKKEEGRKFLTKGSQIIIIAGVSVLAVLTAISILSPIGGAGLKLTVRYLWKKGVVDVAWAFYIAMCLIVFWNSRELWGDIASQWNKSNNKT